MKEREKGAAVVEMAFVTVLLLVLVLGIIDVGRAIYTNIGLQDAAQEGAMYASYNWPVSEETISSVSRDSTNYPQLQPGDIFVTCHGPNAVEVTATYEIDLITPIVGQFLGGSMQLSQSFVGEIFSEGTC